LTIHRKKKEVLIGDRILDSSLRRKRSLKSDRIANRGYQRGKLSMATTADDVWQLLAELATAQKETEKQLKESNQQFNRQIKELGKQIGGLGAKFGSFTKGLALPSMETILRERFGMEIISPSVRASKEGQQMEIDVLAYANGSINTAYIVEVKSHPREDSITQ
jgi:hypothetical protein